MADENQGAQTTEQIRLQQLANVGDALSGIIDLLVRVAKASNCDLDRLADEVRSQLQGKPAPAVQVYQAFLSLLQGNNRGHPAH